MTSSTRVFGNIYCGWAARVSLLLLLLAPCAATRAEAQTAAAQASEEAVLTQAGKLSLARVGEETDMTFELRLGGKTLHKVEAMYANLLAHFRTWSSGELIVLQTSEGGTACPAQFQIVRVEDAGKLSVTEPFGDCGDSPTITLQQLPDEQLSLRFQGYYRLSQEQEPGFRKPPPTTWVYSKGVLKELKSTPPKRQRRG